MWKLVIEDDEGKRTIVPLTRDDYTIGRKEGNTIRLTERNVSREHAKLHKRNGGGEKSASLFYVLEDMTSYNGVYVNGLRVAKTQDLVHGDLVQIGDYRIVLQDDAVVEAPTSVPTMPGADAKTTLPQGLSRGSLLMERPNRLVMLAGPTPGAEYPLDRDRLTIGRAEDATISVNHNSVSRLHCEVHALGEGRYEIVDKGSSNGVRLNSAELKRGIIEAGDIIELGDVRFKFVGAGQIFLPGVNDSQQLAAIGDRPVSIAPRKGGGGSYVPVIVFGAIVGLGAMGIIYAYMRQHAPDPNGTVPTAPTTSTLDPLEYERPVIAEAKRLCANDECEVAHEKIHREIRASSPLRDSDDFKGIDARWAELLLARADGEPDAMKKRGLLNSIRNTLTVPDDLRNRAIERLQKLDEPLAPLPPPVAVKDAGVTPAPRRPRQPVDPTTAPQPHPPTVATPTVKPPVLSDADRASAELLKSPPNLPGARAILETKVFSKRGTPEDVRVLKATCKAMGDKQCVEECKRLQE